MASRVSFCSRCTSASGVATRSTIGIGPDVIRSVRTRHAPSGRLKRRRSAAPLARTRARPECRARSSARRACSPRSSRIASARPGALTVSRTTSAASDGVSASASSSRSRSPTVVGRAPRARGRRAAAPGVPAMRSTDRPKRNSTASSGIVYQSVILARSDSFTAPSLAHPRRADTPRRVECGSASSAPGRSSLRRSRCT